MLRILTFLVSIIIVSGCAHKQHTHEIRVNNQTENLSDGVSQNKEGQYVFINQKAFKVENSLNEVLNSELPKYEGKTVYIELNTTDYAVNETIKLPSKIKSRTIINGNFATINSSLPDSIFVFQKLPDMEKGITAVADTYQSIKNLTIQGKGSGIKITGGYKSSFTGMLLKGMNTGIELEFVLQAELADLHIVSPRQFGIKLNTIPGTGVNTSQCNGSSIKNCRIFAKNLDTGIYIGNSNLVLLEGNIIEGGQIKKGIHFHNSATTVVNFEMTRTHFENKNYEDACVYITGRVNRFLIDQMYYSGVGGVAIESAIKSGYSKIHLSNIGWTGGWEIITGPYGKNGASASTWWFFDHVDGNIKSTFKTIKPYYLWIDGKEIKLPKP